MITTFCHPGFSWKKKIEEKIEEVRRILGIPFYACSICVQSQQQFVTLVIELLIRNFSDFKKNFDLEN